MNKQDLLTQLDAMRALVETLPDHAPVSTGIAMPTVTEDKAAELSGYSKATLEGRRNTGKLQQFEHWWHDSQGRVIYNLRKLEESMQCPDKDPEQVFIEVCRKCKAEVLKKVAIDVFLYVATQGSGLIKIGISQNPRNRLRRIETSSCISIVNVWTSTPMTRDDARILESRLHSKYKKYRADGEWFRDISREQIVAHIESFSE